ncbi:Peptidase_M15_3 domain-containing protein [Azospirillaceae bacterium]
MYYIPKYFKVEELVSPEVYNLHGRNSLYFLDDRITMTLDMLRTYLQTPITVNTWARGTDVSRGTDTRFTQRGYRNDPTVGSTYSAHRFGRAVDFDVKGVSSAMFREWVRSGKLNDCLIYITRMENSVSWNHLDCMGPPKQPGQAIVFV